MSNVLGRLLLVNLKDAGLPQRERFLVNTGPRYSVGQGGAELAGHGGPRSGCSTAALTGLMVFILGTSESALSAKYRNFLDLMESFEGSIMDRDF